MLYYRCKRKEGRSLRGNVDRNLSFLAMLLLTQRRSLRGNVDRNIDRVIGQYESSNGRSLRGNVDRNGFSLTIGGSVTLSFPTWERG